MTAHFLPFETAHVGEAPVSTYFIAETDEQGVLRSSFRGRGLMGTVHLFKQGERVNIAQKKKYGSLSTNASFESLTVWDYDQTPSASTNPTIRSLTYQQLMQELME